jgi:ABC-2 type transport system permease protein
MNNPARLLLGNPVVLKELRGRMRGPRAFIVLTGFLILMGAFIVVLYAGSNVGSSLQADPVDGGRLGRQLFEWLVGIELVLVTFIAPTFTAGAISGERERQTYDLLRTTLLPEGQFVMGKLFSALAYIFLLLLAGIPLQSFSFILGGTDIPDMLIALVTLFATAILLGTMGVYFSARIKHTLPASIMTYGSALTIAIGTLVILGIVWLASIPLLNAGVGQSGEWVILLVRGFLVCLNPPATLFVTQRQLVNQQTPWTMEWTFESGNTTTLPSPWLILVALYLLLSVFFFWLTVRTVKRVDDF